MKKILSTVAIVATTSALALGLTACGDKTEKVTPEVETPIVETETEVETETPEVEIEEEVVEEETTEEDVSEEDVTEETTDENTEVEEEPAVDEETETETEDTEEEIVTEPEEAVDVSIDDIVNAMKEAYGEMYLPNMPLDEEMFLGMTNISKDLFVEFYAEVPMMSAQVDKLFVLKAADGKVEELAKAVEDYNKNVLENEMNYPMNIPKIEKAVVETRGDYVIFYMLGGYSEEMVEDDGTKTPEELDAANAEIQSAYYDEQNEVGKKVLDKLFK